MPARVGGKGFQKRAVWGRVFSDGKQWQRNFFSRFISKFVSSRFLSKKES
jgi:hypothetical protein